MISHTCKEFITKLPKAELHVHIEGTMEPEQMIAIAERNKIKIPAGVLDSSGNYLFSGYEEFIKTYIQATSVLCQEQDFYDITLAYLKKVAGQGVLRTEIFFDLQTYFSRNITPEIIINGMYTAFIEGKKRYHIDAAMIMCFIRNFSEENAFKALNLLQEYKDKVIGVGLASLEDNNPPIKFEHVFARARAQGYHLVGHAGESGTEHIRDMITKLHCERIDHGVGCMYDPSLVQELAQLKIPMTVCPLSNVKLGIFKTLHEHPIKKMFDAGLNISINSDDPAFFGSYIADNYLAAQSLGFSCRDLITCAGNGLQAAFVSEEIKKAYQVKLDEYSAGHAC